MSEGVIEWKSLESFSNDGRIDFIICLNYLFC